MTKSLFKKPAIYFKTFYRFLSFKLGPFSQLYSAFKSLFRHVLPLFCVFKPKKPSCLLFFLCFTQMAKPVLIFTPFNAFFCFSLFISNVGKSGNSSLCCAISELWSTAKLQLQSCFKASALSQNHHVQSFYQPTQQLCF